MSHLFDTYKRLPVDWVRGEGAWLFDADDRRCLDATSGIGVCALGHAHPQLAAALSEQAGELWHAANAAGLPLQEALGRELAALSGLDRAFIANSGAEAIECALKLARRHGHRRGIDRPRVLVTENAFHGRTLAALSASGNAAIQSGYEPLVEGFVRVPFGDLAAAARALEDHPDIAAVLVEPIQGEGGVNIPPDDYLPGLRGLCHAHEALMVLDEIQTGMGRTGRMFAFQHHDEAAPDVMALAKALGNGMPVSACLATDEVAALMTPGSHGSTFGGNPLACRVALAVIERMRADSIVEHGRRAGKHLLEALQSRLGDHPAVVDIRGRGLMIAVELAEDAGNMRAAALERGLFINVTRQRVIRLLPPLIIDDEQTGFIADTLARVIPERTAS